MGNEKQELEDQKLSTATPFDAEPKKEVDNDPRKGLPETVVVEEVSAPTQLQQGDPLARGPWIQYDGVATVRVLGPDDWKNAGVKSNKYYEWNYLNSKRIPVSHFSDEELQYLLRCDGRFSVVED